MGTESELLKLVRDYREIIMNRYWIGVASKEHVLKGVASGFAQVCNGKGGPLKIMAPGDWIIYYSPTEKFGVSGSCQRFTAIGKIKPEEPYLFHMSDDFIPWRRNVDFVKSQEVEIRSLIDNLSFIKNKQHWGFIFRRGCFQIPKQDFLIIAKSMGIAINDKARF